jgi:hypothetical protein
MAVGFHPCRHRVPIAGALVSGLLVLAGCGSSSQPSSPSESASNGTAAGIRLASCMRSHGVPNFPDPTQDGAGSTVGTVDKHSPAFHAARQACGRVQAELAGLKPKQSRAAQLRDARCMRAHGVPGYPDPLPGGGFNIPSTVNPQSPAFIAASNACATKR